MVRIAVVLCTLIATALPVSAELRKTHGEMVLVAVDGFVLPKLEELAQRTKALQRSVGALCQSVDSAIDRRRRDAQTRFEDVVKAWAGAEMFRAGPAKENNRVDRFFFWPDPRGTARRQLARVLATRPANLIEPGELKSHSAALQGLPALESLLYSQKYPLGTETDETGRYRCALANAISSNIETLAAEILTGWKKEGGFRTTMIETGSDNPTYLDAAEASIEIVKAIVAGIDFTVARHALPIMSAAEKKPVRRPKLPFQPSGLTTAYLEASLSAIEELFNLIGLAAFIQGGKPWMKERISITFAQAHELRKILEQTKDLPADEERRLRAARKLKFDLNALRLIIVKELAPAAGLALGFNELDGD